MTIVLIFLQELKKCDVCAVIRVCEPTYDPQLLVKEGIDVFVSFCSTHQFETFWDHVRFRIVLKQNEALLLVKNDVISKIG